MSETRSLAIAAAKRAAFAGVAHLGDDDAATVLSALHHTIEHEAATLGVPLMQRIDALTRALAITVDSAVTQIANDDAAHALMKSAIQLATAQLNTLRTLRRVRAGNQRG